MRDRTLGISLVGGSVLAGGAIPAILAVLGAAAAPLSATAALLGGSALTLAVGAAVSPGRGAVAAFARDARWGELRRPDFVGAVAAEFSMLAYLLAAGHVDHVVAVAALGMNPLLAVFLIGLRLRAAGGPVGGGGRFGAPPLLLVPSCAAAATGALLVVAAQQSSGALLDVFAAQAAAEPAGFLYAAAVPTLVAFAGFGIGWARRQAIEVRAAGIRRSAAEFTFSTAQSAAGAATAAACCAALAFAANEPHVGLGLLAGCAAVGAVRAAAIALLRVAYCGRSDPSIQVVACAESPYTMCLLVAMTGVAPPRPWLLAAGVAAILAANCALSVKRGRRGAGAA